MPCGLEKKVSFVSALVHVHHKRSTILHASFLDVKHIEFGHCALHRITPIYVAMVAILSVLQKTCLSSLPSLTPIDG